MSAFNLKHQEIIPGDFEAFTDRRIYFGTGQGEATSDYKVKLTKLGGGKYVREVTTNIGADSAIMRILPLIGISNIVEAVEDLTLTKDRLESVVLTPSALFPYIELKEMIVCYPRGGNIVIDIIITGVVKINSALRALINPEQLYLNNRVGKIKLDVAATTPEYAPSNYNQSNIPQ